MLKMDVTFMHPQKSPSKTSENQVKVAKMRWIE